MVITNSYPEVIEKLKQELAQAAELATAKAEIAQLKQHWIEDDRDLNELIADNERLRTRLLSAAGDDLCRLSQDEIKAMSAGTVKIPPKEEFLASCERFHEQMASESGVMSNCLTLAQLIAENEKLRLRLTARRTVPAEVRSMAAQILERYPFPDSELFKHDRNVARLARWVESLAADEGKDTVTGADEHG